MKIVTISTLHDLKKAYPVLKELREHLSFDDFINYFEQARSESNYQLIGQLNNENEIVALMGYRVLVDFVHGRHLYIDDLVTKLTERSKGIGANLLREAEKIAKDNSCTNIRLCTGIQNDQGKKFYEKNDWHLRAVVYKKKL